MFKTLFRKELLELAQMYFIDKKTGKKRKKSGLIGYIVLFAFVFISCAFSFIGIGMLFSEFIKIGLDWLYFSVLTIIGIVVAVFIDMFMASSLLFKAKDNDLLLSMPIKPGYILLTRMIGIYIMGLFYYSIVYIPICIVYIIVKGVSLTTILFPLLVFIISSFFTLSLCVIFGYIVTFISSKFKSKTVITIISALALMGLYYLIYFRLQEITENIVSNPLKAASFVKDVMVPFYFMGKAASGDLISLLIFTAIVGVLFFVVYFVLSRNFVNIATSNKGEVKKVYKEEKIVENSVDSVLLKRELKRFLSSTASMLNIGLGILLMPCGGIVLMIKAKDFLPLIELAKTELPFIYNLIPSIIILIGLFVVSIGTYTASSLSLEGNTFYIVKTLPIDYKKFLNAKIKAHMYLFLVPTLIFGVLSCLAIKLDIKTSVIVCMVLFAYTLLIANFGLINDIKHHNFDWTNETYVIKQGASITITLFSSWGFVILYGAATFLLSYYLNVEPYIVTICFFVIIVLLSRIMSNWINTKGVKIIEEL